MEHGVYFPKTTEEFHAILADLGRYAALAGMGAVSEAMADAQFHLAAAERRPVPAGCAPQAPAEPPKRC